MFPEAAKDLVRSGAYAHLVTLNPDGSPHVSMAWAGVDGDDVVIGTLPDQRKLQNIRRDPRVAASFESGVLNRFGLREYLVVYGRAEVHEGGGADLLARLARTYLGPDVTFPPMPDPPPGYVTRIRVERVAGIGPWAQ